MDCLGHYCRTLCALIWLHLSYRDQYTTKRADHFSRPTRVAAAWRSRYDGRKRRRKTVKKKTVVFPATSDRTQGRRVVQDRVEFATRLENDVYLMCVCVCVSRHKYVFHNGKKLVADLWPSAD